MLALVKFLHSNNWEAKALDAPSYETDILPQGIKILVGLYPPSEFVISPNEKSVQPEMPEAERRSEEIMRSDGTVGLNEQIKDLPPKEAEAARSEHELRRQQMKSELRKEMEEDGDIQPCQPLSALGSVP